MQISYKNKSEKDLPDKSLKSSIPAGLYQKKCYTKVFGQKYMIQDRNSYQHQRIKSTENSEYLAYIKNIFLYFGKR